MKTNILKHIILPATATVMALAAASCSNRNEPTVTEVTIEDSDITADAMIGRPVSLERSGNTLLVTDLKGTHHFHAFSTEPASYIGVACKRGQGPDEMAGVILASACTPAPGADGSYIISSPQDGRVWRLDIASDSILPLTPLADNVADIWQLHRLSDSSFIGTNGYVEWPELYTIYTADGKVKKRSGRRRVDSRHASAPPYELTSAYQYSLYTSPTGRHIFAMAGDESGMIYEADGDSLTLTGELTGGDYRYNFTGDGRFLGLDDESTIGFISAGVTDTGFYVLYSGRLFADDDAWQGSEIRRYDLQGRLTNTYKTDKTLRLITRPDDSGIMYAITEDGTDPRIVTIQL